MKTTPSIRMATVADAEMLTELAWRTFYDAFAPMNSPENLEAYMKTNFNLQVFSAQLSDPRATFLIAEIESTAIAFAKLFKGQVPDCVGGITPVEIERFYVDQKFHGKGIAHRLMEACYDIARQSGHNTVYLGVWENNHRAIAFYRKCGFEFVGSHVFQLGTETQKDFLMEKSLLEPAQ